MKGLTRRMPSITDLDAYLDNDLTPAARRQVEEALSGSAALRAELEELRRLRSALAISGDPADFGQGPNLVARFREARAGAASAPFHSKAAPTPAAIEPPRRDPLVWVASTYLVMGLVFCLLGKASVIMFSDLQATREHAALWSSLLELPYILKFLWAPLVELYRTKKFFVVVMQLALSGSLAGLAAAVGLSGTGWPGPVLLLLAVTALLGATQDIAADGVYVTALGPKAQTAYFGFQTMFWHLGQALATGPVVIAAGVVQAHGPKGGASWGIVLLAVAGLVLLAAVHHGRVLPAGDHAADAPATLGDAVRAFGRAYVTFFEKKGVVAMIAFAFLYRIGYSLLEKVGPMYMKDPGGLGLSLQLVGLVNGTIGTIALVIGSFLGAHVVSRIGLRSSLLTLCLCLNIPSLAFLLISHVSPANIGLISVLVVIAKVGSGMGSVGHMLYMMQQIAPGPYKTAHYTFATALMGGCVVAGGAISGLLVDCVGYPSFFLIVLVTTIPSVLVTLFAPFYSRDPGSHARPAHA